MLKKTIIIKIKKTHKMLYNNSKVQITHTLQILNFNLLLNFLLNYLKPEVAKNLNSLKLLLVFSSNKIEIPILHIV
jgi:hypothetical protein